MSNRKRMVKGDIGICMFLGQDRRKKFFDIGIRRGDARLGVIRNFGKKMGWVFTPCSEGVSFTEGTVRTILTILENPHLYRKLWFEDKNKIKGYEK